MICAGFLSAVDRADLTALARDGSAAHRLARRAHALVLLDSGWSCEKVAGAVLLDDDTIRRWHGLFIEDGLEGLTRFEAGRWQRLPDERRATGKTEGLDCCGFAALDAPDRRLDRDGIRSRL